VYSRPVDPLDHSPDPEAGGYGMFKLGDKEAGGKVIAGPIDVMGEGTMGVLADPSGAVIGIWQPGRHRGLELRGVPGSFTWAACTMRPRTSPASGASPLSTTRRVPSSVCCRTPRPRRPDVPPDGDGRGVGIPFIPWTL